MIFVDAIVVKVRDGQVRNTPFYVVMGVTTNGERDILGIWAGDGAEGARFWLQVFSQLKNRGVDDVLIAVCDGLKGLPEAITSFHYAGRQHRDAIVKALKGGVHRPVRGRGQGPVRRVRPGVGRQVSGDREAVGERVGRVRAVPRIRRGDQTRDLYDERDRVDQRPLPASGERPRPLPQRDRRHEVPVPDHPLPDPTGHGRARWVVRWKPALNVFAITFAGRFERTTH